MNYFDDVAHVSPDELRRIFEWAQSFGPVVREARLHDRGAWEAFKEHVELATGPQPEHIALLGITIYEDAEIPPGTLRLYFTDGTTKDLYFT